MLTVMFGQSTISRAQSQLQYNRFKEGQEDDNDNASSDGPSMPTNDDNIEAVKKMTLDNHRITIREVADDVGTSFGSCQAYFANVLGMKPKAVKIVPKLPHK